MFSNLQQMGCVHQCQMAKLKRWSSNMTTLVARKGKKVLPVSAGF